MAEYKESQLWSLLRSKFKVPGIQLTRIENIASSGVPDLIITCDGITRFVELKVTERKHYLFFRPAQIVWMKEHIKANGRPKCIFHYNNYIGLLHMENAMPYLKFDKKYFKLDLLGGVKFTLVTKSNLYDTILMEALNDTI